MIIGRGLICALFMLSGCTGESAPSAPPTANLGQASASGTREAALAAITDRCGLPRTALRMNGDLLALNPPSGAGQEEVDCLLREISANGLTANLQIGFVGNELPEGNNVQSR